MTLRSTDAKLHRRTTNNQRCPAVPRH